MAVYKRGNNWYLDYYVGKRRQRELVGPVTKREAEKALAKRLVDIKEGRFFDTIHTQDLTFDEVKAEYIDWARKNLKSPRFYETILGALETYFKGRLLRQIKPSDIRKYRDWRLTQTVKGKGKKLIKKSTVNREIAVFRSIFNKLIAEERFDRNPCGGVKSYNEEEFKNTVFIDDDQFTALYKAALESPKAYMPLVVKLGYQTGMRKGEISKLERSEIDLERGQITLHAKKTKTSKHRIIPLTPSLVKDLKEHLAKQEVLTKYVFHHPNGKPIEDFDKAFETIVKNAKLPRMIFHSLRHSFISKCLRDGMNEKSIMNITGHRTRSTFDRYAHLRNQDVKKIFEQVQFRE